MIRTETDIMALVERVQQTRAAMQATHAARVATLEAWRVADEAANKALIDFKEAENSLLVAAGGEDRSFEFAR